MAASTTPRSNAGKIAASLADGHDLHIPSGLQADLSFENVVQQNIRHRPGAAGRDIFPCSSFTVLICCLEKIDDPVVLIKDAMITRSLVPAA